jgi:hypothetical protein
LIPVTQNSITGKKRTDAEKAASPGPTSVKLTRGLLATEQRLIPRANREELSVVLERTIIVAEKLEELKGKCIFISGASVLHLIDTFKVLHVDMLKVLGMPLPSYGAEFEMDPTDRNFKYDIEKVRLPR